MYKISVCLRALSRGRPSVTGAIHILLLGSGVSLSHATETPSFAALLQQAQLSAPYLLEQAANVRAASADARQAGAWVNPSLSVTAENLGAPLSGGLSQRQDTYAITQVFEVGGKRSARIEAEQLKSAPLALANARPAYPLPMSWPSAMPPQKLCNNARKWPMPNLSGQKMTCVPRKHW